MRPNLACALRVGALLACSMAMSGCLNEGLIKQPELTVIPGLPTGWSGTANTSGIGTTVTDRHGGATAAYLSSAFQVGFRSNLQLSQAVRADNYRGKRVRLSAWVKPRNVSNVVNSGLWMRVDGPGLTLEYDHMATRVVSGYGDWRQVSVVLDVPANAIGISFGAHFQATNTLLVDDMLFAIVGTDVVSTNTLSTPTPDSRDSATIEADYAQRPLSPVNLDFEGLVALGSSATARFARGAATPLRAVRARRVSIAKVPEGPGATRTGV
ncbi:MAG: hypothetical protein ABMA00_12375 [Gemmatimonas sp.]